LSTSGRIRYHHATTADATFLPPLPVVVIITMTNARR
jgi:hypothetical protein